MAETSENAQAAENSDSGGQAPESTEAKQPTEAAQPEGAQPTEVSPEVSKDARMWAMICHLAALGGFVIPIIGAVIGPLIIWQIKKDEFRFVDEQGKEAVNFQISMLIYGVVAGLLCFACVGFVLLPAVVIVDLVFLLIAAVKANNGQSYRYPLTIRFIK
jgi:uncharacterized Tic20 family protein